MPGEQLTVWTIRLALALFAAVLLARLASLDGPRWEMVARWFWTAGCLLALAHGICAFHFVHHWSHEHAFNDTAARTKELTGMEVGAGIYFNYAFVIIWAWDVGWWWSSPKSYRQRSHLWNVPILGFLLFIAVNGAIVFESGPTRVFGFAAGGAMLVLLLRKTWQSRSSR